jgi:hypothetical protein
MRVDRARLAFLWRRGGNWLVFLLAWAVSAAIIGAIENTVEVTGLAPPQPFLKDQKLTEEARLAKETQGMVAALTDVKVAASSSASLSVSLNQGEIEDRAVRDHIEELVKLISRWEPILYLVSGKTPDLTGRRSRESGCWARTR